MSTTYDPDELELSKNDVLDLIDAVLFFWNKNKKENWHYIIGLGTMRIGVKITPEGAVKKIWNTLLKFMWIVQYENAIHKALKNKEEWAMTLLKLKQKIATDGIDKALENYTKKK